MLEFHAPDVIMSDFQGVDATFKPNIQLAVQDLFSGSGEPAAPSADPYVQGLMDDMKAQVRQPPSWPRSWTNSSLL